MGNSENFRREEEEYSHIGLPPFPISFVVYRTLYAKLLQRIG